ncbi:hypothetical protein [Duganella aceris]|jgi:hypothetical protein|uniref:Uncharacterized protein n=1 Tax=Duganella aceris TaxID=2703883 RepID=A0ABX0FUJ7_9BURK|nr:hypothetical protein [Duganella aceris]NGZ88073.1 hypothetical protein [Duganella aceris]
MLTRDTDMIIEELINSSCGEAADPRCRHLLFHALHGLVRTAQAEQLRRLRSDVELATGGAAQMAAGGVSLTAGCGSGSTGPT